MQLDGHYLKKLAASVYIYLYLVQQEELGGRYVSIESSKLVKV